MTAQEAKATTDKAGADKVAAAANDAIDKTTTTLGAAVSIGTKAVTKAVVDATAKGNVAISAAQKNTETQVNEIKREVTRLEALTLEQLHSVDESSVSYGTTIWQGMRSWIGRQWDSFADSTVGQIVIIVVAAAVVFGAMMLLSPIVGAVVGEHRLGLFAAGLAASAINMGIATYNN